MVLSSPCLDTDVDQVIKLSIGKNYEVDLFEDMIADRVVKKDDKIYAYGAVKNFAEAVLIVDELVSKDDKIAALKDLLEQAYLETKNAGLSQLHVFTKNRPFANFLRKRHGFRRINCIALVREIDG